MPPRYLAMLTPCGRVVAMRSPAPDFDWTRGDELPADLQGAG